MKMYVRIMPELRGKILPIILDALVNQAIMLKIMRAWSAQD